jgi:hypothetical protein
MAIVFLMGTLVMACGETIPDNPTPEPEPEPEALEDLRGYTEKNEKTDVKMSDETIFVKGKLSEDLNSYNAATGTISFRNSNLLRNQEIKVGDILYSTDRTEKTPDGYCLRVISIKESGGVVTYETEPATALEAIDYLNESGILSAGNYKPEDIRIFGIPEDEDAPKTRGIFDDDSFEFEIKGDKFDFFSDLKTTRFGYILYEEKNQSTDLKSSLKIKISLELQHELDTEKSNIMFDYGTFVMFTMFKVGVTAKLEIGTALALEGNQESLLSKEQEKMAKERLIGKKFKIAEIPLNFTCSKVIVNPKYIVYGEFKLDLSGKLVLEAGIKDGYYAFNLENMGYFSPDFITRSYLRKVTHFHPVMHMEGTLGFTAMAGFGVGINFEIPSLPVITRDEGNIDSKITEPSAVGLYFGTEMTEDIDVVVESDFFSGNRTFKIEGKNGGLKLKASIEGKIGLKKKVFGSLDWTFWENEMITLPDWTWNIYSWTPTPYDLQADVNNEDATVVLSWKVPDRNGLSNTSTVNIGLDAWEDVSLAPFAVNLEEHTTTFGPAVDGPYHWNVTTHSVDGGAFPSDTCSFVINASKVVTGDPVIDGGNVTVPVSIKTYNDVLERGVVYSAGMSEPLYEVDNVCKFDGKDMSFNLQLPNLDHSLLYYVRAYAVISYAGGRKLIYGNTCLFRPPSGGEHYETPEAVDLGLSVKWASFNLGATKNVELGYYYAWGETKPYYSNFGPFIWYDGKDSGYDWPSYKWCNGTSDQITKYYTDGLTQLESDDDAAHVNLGGKWRTPTVDEWKELLAFCTFTWTSLEGRDGLLVTSNKPGYTHAFIFLPAAGLVEKRSTHGLLESGYYWTSCINTGDSVKACLSFFETGSSEMSRGWVDRCLGLPIRPVYGDQTPLTNGDIEGTVDHPWN